MAKKSYVLEALRVLVPQEIIKIAEFLRLRNKPFTKPLESLKSSHHEGSSMDSEVSSNTEELDSSGDHKVLDFSSSNSMNDADSNSADSQKVQEKKTESDEEDNVFDLMLRTRSQMKHQKNPYHHLLGLSEYKKNSHTLTRRIKGNDGKDVYEKIKTTGVLIDKKQA